MWEEQDLGIDIVHGWFTEGGDSILGNFRALKKEARRRLTSFLMKAIVTSHMICQDVHVRDVP